MELVCAILEVLEEILLVKRMNQLSQILEYIKVVFQKISEFDIFKERVYA